MRRPTILNQWLRLPVLGQEAEQKGQTFQRHLPCKNTYMCSAAHLEGTFISTAIWKRLRVTSALEWPSQAVYSLLIARWFQTLRSSPRSGLDHGLLTVVVAEELIVWSEVGVDWFRKPNPPQ